MSNEKLYEDLKRLFAHHIQHAEAVLAQNENDLNTHAHEDGSKDKETGVSLAVLEREGKIIAVLIQSTEKFFKLEQFQHMATANDNEKSEEAERIAFEQNKDKLDELLKRIQKNLTLKANENDNEPDSLPQKRALLMS